VSDTNTVLATALPAGKLTFAPAEFVAEGRAYRTKLWTPGAIFGWSKDRLHKDCCRALRRIARVDLDNALVPANEAPELDKLEAGAFVLPAPAGILRATAWLGAAYAFQAYTKEAWDAWTPWAFRLDGVRQVVATPAPRTFPGSDMGAIYHAIAWTEIGCVAVRILPDKEVRLRIQRIPGQTWRCDMNLDLALNDNATHYRWPSAYPDHVSLVVNDAAQARAAIAHGIRALLTKEGLT
jgi:hypothetical protein